MLAESSTESEVEDIFPPLLDSRNYSKFQIAQQEKMTEPSDKDWLRWAEIFAAELIGTALLMLFGCMGQFGSLSSVVFSGPMQGGLVFGFVITSIIVAIGHISNAHLNPAVTLCSYLLGHIQLITAVIYFFAEILGAVLGFVVLKEITPRDLYNSYVSNSTCGFCNTVLHPTINISQGFLIEFLATSFLIFIICSIWDSRNSRNTDSIAIRFGLYIAAISIAAGPFTGASLNPVRSFAPALINNIWTNHWIYWLAPLSGSVVTTLFYKTAFMRGIFFENDRTQPQLTEPILLKS